MKGLSLLLSLLIPILNLTCTVVLKGGPVYPDLGLGGELPSGCFKVEEIGLSGANPFLEQEARVLLLKALATQETKNCQGPSGVRVTIRNLSVNTSVSAYGYPPHESPQAIPSPSLLTVVLKGEFQFLPCIPNAPPLLEAFVAERWIPYDPDPYRNEEAALLVLRELVDTFLMRLTLRSERLLCSSLESESLHKE